MKRSFIRFGFISTSALFLCILVLGSWHGKACTLPVPSVSSSGQLTFCSGGSVTLTSSSGAGYSYQWKKDGNPINNATNSTYAATQSGTYVVEVTLDTCVETSNPVVITVNPTPTGSITSDQVICQGTSVTLIANGGTTYNWSAPGANGNRLTVSPNSTTTYMVTITNSFGCNDVEDVEVTVKPQPLATISVAGSTTLCSGQSVNLNASGGAGYTYQWCLNSQPIPGATSQQYTVSAAGNYQVITMLNGCSKESPGTMITVNPVPTPTITPDMTTCAGDTVTLQATGGTSYQWAGGGPATADYIVAPTTNRTYTVTVTNSYNCTQTASTTLTVKPLPNANISIGGSANLCQGQSVTLNASNGTGYSHQWYIDNSILGAQQSPSLTVSSQGGYHVVVSLNGCSKKSAVQNITVNPLPIPSVTPGVTICAGDSTTMTASGGTSYQWASGGPATASYKVAPTSTKTYTVTVSNSFSCTASASVVITVTPLPNASVSLSGPATFCADRTLTMTASTGTGYSYEWTKDSAPISGASSNVYIASQTGTYQVQVTANGCSRKSTATNVTVNPLPVPTASPDKTICSGDTTQLTASGGVSYQWFNGSTSATISVSPTNTTTYGVTVTNGFGCSATESVVVSTIARPTATVNPIGSIAVCTGLTATLTASSGTGYSYQWYEGTSLLNGQTNVTLEASQSGNYSVIVTANGCPKKSNTVAVNVNSVPTATASNDTTICSGHPATLIAYGGNTYKWSTGSTNQSINVSPTATTTYLVTVTSGQNCSATESVVVNVIPSPNANVTLSGTTTICQNDTVTLTASSGVGYAYQWKKDNNDLVGETQGSYKAGAAGSYTVLVSALGCSKTSAPVQVTVNTLPTASVNTDSVTICQGVSVDLTAFGGTSYRWSNGRFTQTNSVNPNTTSTYTVTVTDANGCTDTEQSTVVVLPLPSANVTQSGSPNLCLGETITLNASSGTGYSYQWKKDGIAIGGATNSTYQAGETGAFTAEVTLNGCSKTSAPVQVNVTASLTATASNDTTICAGDTINLFAAGGSIYTWSSGETTDSIIAFPTSNKTYSITVSNGTTCTDVETIVVTVKPRPNAFISVAGGVSSVCDGQTATLNANTGTGLTYQWYKDSLKIADADSSRYITGSAGTYTLEVTLNGCSRMSAPKPLGVNPLPVVTLSNDTTVCSESPVTLVVSGGVSYMWNTFATDSVYKITTATTKTYTVTVTNSFGCKSSDQVVVTTLPLPTNVTISTTSSTSICEGKAVRLNVGNTNGTEFQWKLDATDIPDAVNPSFDAAETGDYTVVVTGNGCSKTSPKQHVTVKPTPDTPEVLPVGTDSLTCSIAGSNYKWFRNGQTFNVGSKTVKITKSGAYSVYVTENNCSSDTSAVYYFQMTGVDSPNESELLIYPNPGNGSFTLALPNLKPNAEVTVYNVIGEQVWETQPATGARKLNIDLTHLPQGLYHVRAEGITRKLVIAY